MGFIDGEAVNTDNKFMVGQTGMREIVIMNPPRGPISKHDALVFAAWIATLADNDGLSFEAALDAVQSA